MSADLAFTINARDLAALDKKLKGLPAELIRKIQREAMKLSLAPTHEAIMQRVPVGETGNLAEGIEVSTKTITSGAEPYMYGMVSTSGAPAAHLVEWGHEQCDHEGNPTGKHVPPHPFMLPALLETSDRAVAILAKQVEAGIAKCGVLT